MEVPLKCIFSDVFSEKNTKPYNLNLVKSEWMATFFLGKSYILFWNCEYICSFGIWYWVKREMGFYQQCILFLSSHLINILHWLKMSQKKCFGETFWYSKPFIQYKIGLCLYCWFLQIPKFFYYNFINSSNRNAANNTFTYKCTDLWYRSGQLRHVCARAT